MLRFSFIISLHPEDYSRAYGQQTSRIAFIPSPSTTPLLLWQLCFATLLPTNQETVLEHIETEKKYSDDVYTVVHYVMKTAG
jgi:hypothetical protein